MKNIKMDWFCFPISRESDASEEGIKEAEWSSAGCFGAVWMLYVAV